MQRSPIGDGSAVAHTLLRPALRTVRRNVSRLRRRRRRGNAHAWPPVSDSGHKKRAERQCRTSVPPATKKIDHCEMPAGLYCDCQGGVSRETPHVQDPSDLCCIPRRKRRRRGRTIQPITCQPITFSGQHLGSDALQRQSNRPSAVEDGGEPRRACRQHHRRGQRIHERLHQRRKRRRGGSAGSTPGSAGSSPSAAVNLPDCP